MVAVAALEFHKAGASMPVVGTEGDDGSEKRRLGMAVAESDIGGSCQ